jgi:hypothetical protein
MDVRRVLIAILGATAALVPSAAGTSGPAVAQTSDCKTSVSQLIARGDSGNAGDWAFDTMTRTVMFCQTAPAGNLDAIYSFQLTDVGTFVTIPGANQPALSTATPLLGPQTGTIKGGISGTFTAAADFKTYHDWANGQVFAGTPQGGCQTPTATNGGEPTSCWIPEYFSDFQTLNPNLDTTAKFSWSYSACGVTPPDPNYGWIDAYNNGSGTEEPQAGNISGKPCPAPAPTPTSKPSPTPSGVPGLPATGVDPTA